MKINTVIDFIKVHPLYAILGAGALVLLLFAAANGIGKTIETIRANRFDAKQQAYERQVSDLKTEREVLIKKANDAEAKALLKETEAKELKDLIDQKGGAIEVAANKLQKDIENAKANAGNCVDAVDPRGCTCQKLRAAGFACE